MIKEGKIGVQEAICLITTTITVKIYFTSPAYTAKAVGTASWYMTLISAATAMIGFTFLYLLLKRFPGKDLVQAFELSLGRVIGFAFSILLAVFLMINAVVVLREFAEITKIYVLPLTPPSVVMGTFLVMMTVACFLGLEAIVRFSKLIAYILLAGFLIVVVLSYNNYDYHNLFPFFGYGLDKTIIVGVSRSSFYGEVIILGVIATSLQGTSHIKKVGYTTLIISGLLTATGLITTMMAFNYATAQEIASRMYVLARIIHVGDFLQRLDPFFIFTWNIGTLIGVTAVFYASVSTYCKTFRIQDMRPVIIPYAIILFALSLIPQDLTTIAEYVQVLREYGWTVSFGLPLITLIIAFIRGKKGSENGA